MRSSKKKNFIITVVFMAQKLNVIDIPALKATECSRLFSAKKLGLDELYELNY